MKKVKRPWVTLVIGTIQGHRIKEWAILIFLFTVFSCSGKKLFEKTGTTKGFNDEEWKRDSLSCDGKRPELAKILIAKKSMLLRLNRGALVKTLGKANIIGNKNNSYAYFIEKGPQCLNINDKDYKDIQTKMIVVDFKDERVVDLNIIIP